MLYDAFFRTIFCFVISFVIPIYCFLDLIDMQLIDSLSGGYIFGLAKGNAVLYHLVSFGQFGNVFQKVMACIRFIMKGSTTRYFFLLS